MSITKRTLAEKIKRRLGFPVVKVELDNTQIMDAIDLARDKFIKWAVGQATQETYFTFALSAGQLVYDLPIGVTEVVGYTDQSGTTGGINTLFTIDNFLYSQGFYDSLFNTAGTDYTIVSYHIARDFLETVRKYTPSKYNWKYHRYQNQLEINPAPPSGSVLTILRDGVEYTIDSPGFVLLRAYMIEGSSSVNGWQPGDTDPHFYTNDWIYDYATAEAKEILGRIRSKFAQFASIGNTGIALDGDSLIQEAREDKRDLEEKLRLEEVWDGYGIEIGW